MAWMGNYIPQKHWLSYPLEINSLAPGRFQRNLRKVIFQLISVIDVWSISCKIVLKWMPMDLTDGKSTLVQVMACCRQATSHYLSQCWPRSLSPYGISRPQCVKVLSVPHSMGLNVIIYPCPHIRYGPSHLSLCLLTVTIFMPTPTNLLQSTYHPTMLIDHFYTHHNNTRKSDTPCSI